MVVGGDMWSWWVVDCWVTRGWSLVVMNGVWLWGYVVGWCYVVLGSMVGAGW